MSATEGGLAPLLRRLIAADGPLPVDRFMALALGHPEHGYYMAREPFGRAGDFVTAPEISQMFGELVGVWCIAVWQAMGAPAAVNLVELGPGRGTLMADLVRAAAVAPGFAAAVRVHLVETSPALRQRQGAALERSGVAPSWHGRLAEVPDGPAIVVANEFFDALPVRQAVRAGAGWHERVVGVAPDGGFRFGLGERIPDAAMPAWAADAGPGAVAEMAPAREAVAAELADRLAMHGGAALVVDYGHDRPGLGDTLQAVRGHAYADPLAAPGLADLTAHVDFASLAAAARCSGAAVHGPMAQGAFLAGLGLAERAAALARDAAPEARDAVAAAARRLADAAAMGQLFKAMAITHPDLPRPVPFPSETK